MNPRVLAKDGHPLNMAESFCFDLTFMLFFMSFSYDFKEGDELLNQIHKYIIFSFIFTFVNHSICFMLKVAY